MGKSGVRPAQCRYCIRAANRAGVRKPASCICTTYLRAKGGGLWSRLVTPPLCPCAAKGFFVIPSYIAIWNDDEEQPPCIVRKQPVALSHASRSCSACSLDPRPQPPPW